MKKSSSFIKKASAFLAALLVCAGSITFVSAEEVQETSAIEELLRGKEGYSAVLYDNTNGLPTSEANAVAETAEGFIWIGSYGGLIRYDGNTFERVNSEFGVSSVVDLFVDSKDRLWIGTNDSGVAVMENGKVRIYNKNDGLRSLYVCSVAEDINGTIYVSTTQGVAYIGEDMTLSLIDEPQLNNEYVQSLRIGPDNIVYGLNKSGSVFTLKDGKLLDFYDASRSPISDIRCIVPDPKKEGYVYIGTTGTSIYSGKLSDGLDSLTAKDISPLEFVNDIERLGDQLWVCTDKGVGILENGEFYRLTGLPMNSSVECILTDYQNNLWFASSKQGVMKIVVNQFTDVFEEYGLSPDVVNTTCVYNGMLLVGRKGEGLVALGDDGNIKTLPISSAKTASGENVESSNLASLTDGSQIRSIICDSKNRLWISEYGKYALVCYENGSVTCFTTDDGLPSERVRTVYERADGSIMVVGTGGVSIIRDGKITELYGENAGISNTEILTAIEDAHGDMILGTDGNGIYIVSGKKVEHIGIDSGLASEVVLRVKNDVSRDLVWIVTSNSIAYMDNSRKVTTIKKFPYTNNFDLYENGVGDMWVLSSNGVYVTTVDDMINNGEIPAVLYSRHDGLPCISTANSYSELTQDGTLYIAGTTGVARVNIETPLESIDNVKLAVPWIEADGQLIYPDENGNFNVSSGVKKLTIYDYIFTYSLMDPQVAYHLEGFDNTDTTLRRSELSPVDYTNLSGGTYHFIMRLTDGHGNYGNSISVTITKQKAIYEQTWFYTAAVVLLIAAVAGIVMLIYRRKTNKLLAKGREQKEFIREVTEVLAKTIDMKDKYTNGHSSRVAKYTAMLTRELGYDEETVDKYYNIALLHDIGKISVPEEVLNKNGKLTDEEFGIIKSHAALGGETLKEISIMPELAIGAECHHERPDGKGYPKGLKGEEIPRVAQIIAVADAFDAMYSDRPYRKRMNFDKVVSIMKEVSGTQLTTDVVEAFLRLVDKGEMRDKNDTGGGTTEDIDNIRRKQNEEPEAAPAPGNA